MRLVEARDSALRLDPLRRLGSALLAEMGLAPVRAASLASHLVWHDSAGLPEHGMASLPEILERIKRGEIDPKSEGKIGPERASTAVIDGRNGIPALILGRAAGIACEKSRDVGVGLVRVRGIGPAGPVAAIVAEMSVGPVAAVALGPQGAWSVALPTAEGLPLVGDSALGNAIGPPDGFFPWRLVIEADEWLLQAVAVAALEPLASFQDRVARAGAGAEDRSGWLRPSEWEARRRQAREFGVMLPPDRLEALRGWAERLGVEDRSLRQVVAG